MYPRFVKRVFNNKNSRQAKARAGRYEELIGLTEFIQYPGEVPSFCACVYLYVFVWVCLCSCLHAMY